VPAVTDAAVTIQPAELAEDRFSRYRLLHWWDQDRIGLAKVLVVGAGALGNEILKNLALLGFRSIVIVDLDRIEVSNLSRSVLFRPHDVGRGKAEAAADAITGLYPDACVRPLEANVLLDIGLGLFAWADVILAGLDNREARLWINRCAWKVHRPWIDGAIEGLNGLARVFLPGTPPCYECTLGETDWAILARRMSCNLLTHEEISQGRVPTTPTTSSVIAGIQVQEALKYLHGLPTLSGKAFVFEGLNHTSYVVEYTENPDCLSHYSPDRIVSLDSSSGTLTLAALHARACQDLGAENISIEFSRDIIHKLICPECGAEQEIHRPVGAVSSIQGRCPVDGVLRTVQTVQSYNGSEPFGVLPLSALGLPPWDLYIARAGLKEIGYLIAGDAPSVLGPLHGAK
jgi:adenylyltransferase/sulfurtransferase